MVRVSDETFEKLTVYAKKSYMSKGSAIAYFLDREGKSKK